MKKFFKVLQWIVVNSIMLTLIMLGLFYHYQWAYNLTIFLSWVMIIVSILAGIMSSQKELIKKSNWKIPELSVPVFIDVFYDVCIVFIFASQAWFWTAGFWIIQMAMMKQIRNARKEQANEADSK